MNLTQVLGALTLITGGALLVSESLLGQGLITEWIGSEPVSVQLSCVIAVILGGVALRVGQREKQETGDRH